MKKIPFLKFIILFVIIYVLVPSVYSYNSPNVNFIGENETHKLKTYNDEELLIILDYSSSMMKRLNDKSRAAHAVYALYSVLETIPKGSKIGLRVFGPDEQSMHEYPNGINTRRDCKATKLAVPISADNVDNLRSKLSEYTRPFGETPIAYSLSQAINNDFKERDSLKHIVLITDGGEGCGGNPCKLISDIMRLRSDIKIDVIAIAGDEKNSFLSLSCLPNATNGNFIVVDNSDDLYTKMKSTITYLPKQKFNPTPSSSMDYPKTEVAQIPDTNKINQNIVYSNYLFEFNN